MSFDDFGGLKAFLKRHGLAPDKSLGQHYLCSQPVIDAIVASCEGLPGLLEIGPGPGILTGPLSLHADRLVAIELDSRFGTALKESAPSAQIVQGDALKINLSEILQGLPQPCGVVSNLPYYITGPLLVRITEVSEHWSKAILMMQKEVADKILAPVGQRERGAMSVLLQRRFDIRRVSRAPAGCFLPPPKVDSTVLEFLPTGLADDPDLSRLVRIAFAQPRKTLVNNLVAGLHWDRTYATDAVEELGVDSQIRPHEVETPAFLELSLRNKKD